MYYDDFRFHRGPSVDDDPTLSGPSGAHPSSAQEGQTGQSGSTPRMNLNGQSVDPRRGQSGQPDRGAPYTQYRQGAYAQPRRDRQYPPAGETQARRQTAKKKNPWGRRIAGLILCGLLFGGVAGMTFHGTTALLASGSSDSGPVATQLSATAVGPLDVSSIAKNTLPSVVSITNTAITEVNDWFSFFYTGGSGRTEETVSVGSGVLIQQTEDALYIVTNYHVVEGATTLSATFADDQSYEARIVGGDQANDIAVIRVPLSTVSDGTLSAVRVAAVGDSDQLEVGQQVVAIGNALGYGQSVTTGVVSALDRSLSGNAATYIQTDTAINPGNSGGALVNMNGEVVGINTAKLASTEVEGMGYAIPMARVAEIVNSIISRSGTL